MRPTGFFVTFSIVSCPSTVVFSGV